MSPEPFAIQLNRPLKISSFICEMEISIQKPAGFFHTIAKLTDENGKINEQILVEQFGLSVPMAKRALQRCIDHYKILEIDPRSPNNYHLTAGIGLDLLKEQTLFFNESGKYRLILTDDPLVPQRVISIQRFGRQIDRSAPITKPYKFNLDNTIFQNLIIANENDDDGFISSPKIRIDKCFEQAFEERPEDHRLYLLCSLMPNNIALKIQGSFLFKSGGYQGRNSPVNKKDLKITLENQPPNFTFPYIFGELLNQINLIQDWDQDKNALKVHFDLKDGSCNYDNFLTHISIDHPSIPAFGAFEKFELTLPIIPKSRDDCLGWEKYLFLRAITQPIAPDAYKSLKSKIEHQMKSKNVTYIALPSQEKIAQELLVQAGRTLSNGIYEFDRRSNLYWFLQCPLDLTNAPKQVDEM